jgi:integrase
MEYVEPIKEIERIHEMKILLKKKSLRDYLLFVIGINTGLRIHDLLQLKVEDIWDGERSKEFLYLNDSNGDSIQSFYLNQKVRHALSEYLSQTALAPTDFLFKSNRNHKPITRQQAYRIINHAAKEVGIPGKIGTHTLRKTFGYHAYKKGIAISLLQAIFNHTSSSETLRYIGISQPDKYEIKIDVNL